MDKKEQKASTKAYGIERDGFLPGSLPGYRVITVTITGKETKVEKSKQLYILPEAEALVEDSLRLGLGL